MKDKVNTITCKNEDDCNFYIYKDKVKAVATKYKDGDIVEFYNCILTVEEYKKVIDLLKTEI